MGRSEDESRAWPDNLEAQGSVVAAILRELLMNGILRVELGVDQFREDIRNAGYPEGADFERLFSDMVIWLRDEGVIRFGQITDDGNGGDYFIDCVLTGSGMDLLRRKADVFGGMSAAEVIMSPPDKNASAAQLAKLGSLIGGVIGGFTKSIA
jgi:hypothetical protein